MRYYLSVMHRANVDIAYPDTVLKAHITRDQTFMIYGAFNDVLLFKDPTDAARYAMNYYIHHGPQTKQDGGEFNKDNANAKFTKNYRRDLFIFTREQPVTLIFEVEGPNESDLKDNKVVVSLRENLDMPKADVAAYKLHEKSRLDLVCVVVGGLAAHYSEKYAKLENRSLTVKLSDPQQKSSQCSLC